MESVELAASDYCFRFLATERIRPAKPDMILRSICSIQAKQEYSL